MNQIEAVLVCNKRGWTTVSEIYQMDDDVSSRDAVRQMLQRGRQSGYLKSRRRETDSRGADPKEYNINEGYIDKLTDPDIDPDPICLDDVSDELETEILSSLDEVAVGSSARCKPHIHIPNDDRSDAACQTNIDPGSLKIKPADSYPPGYRDVCGYCAKIWRDRDKNE